MGALSAACNKSVLYPPDYHEIILLLAGRFSGLHDMLKIVMAGELEIIVSEER